MAFFDLDEATRKQVYKKVTIDRYRKTAEKMSKNSQLQFFKYLKCGYAKADKQKIINFIEDHYTELNNPVVKTMIVSFDKLLDEKLDGFREILKCLHGKTLEELTDDDREILDSHKKAYDDLKLGLSFENMIRMHCVSSNAEEAKENHEEEMSEKIAKGLRDKEKELTELNNDYLDARNKWKKEKDKILKTLSPKGMSSSISKVLGTSIKGKTYSEVYDLLNKEEEKSFREKDMDRVKQILAGKYALAEMMKGEK